MKTTKPTSGNLRVSEINNGDVGNFHEYASARHSEMKSGDTPDPSIEDESNAHDASTTNVSPRDYRA